MRVELQQLFHLKALHITGLTQRSESGSITLRDALSPARTAHPAKAEDHIETSQSTELNLIRNLWHLLTFIIITDFKALF